MTTSALARPRDVFVRAYTLWPIHGEEPHSHGSQTARGHARARRGSFGPRSFPIDYLSAKGNTPLMKFSQLTNRVRRWMQNRGLVS